MDEIVVSKERLVRLQKRIVQSKLEVMHSPYSVRERLAKAEKELDDIMTGQPSSMEEGLKYDR